MGVDPSSSARRRERSSQEAGSAASRARSSSDTSPKAVIVRDGVRGASMRQVAEEADVSLGLLSYHFDDKESLILAAFERATTRLLAASDEAIEGIEDPDARVRAFLRGSFDDEFLDGDYLRLRISLWAVAVTDEAVAAVDARFYGEYSAAYRALVATARPQLDADELDRRVTAVIAMSNGVWLNWARFGRRADLDDGLARCDAIALA